MPSDKLYINSLTVSVDKMTFVRVIYKFQGEV